MHLQAAGKSLLSCAWLWPYEKVCKRTHPVQREICGTRSSLWLSLRPGLSLICRRNFHPPQKLKTSGPRLPSKPYRPGIGNRRSSATMGGRSTLPAIVESSKAEHSSQEAEAPRTSPPEQKGDIPAKAGQESASVSGKSAEEAKISGTCNTLQHSTHRCLLDAMFFQGPCHTHTGRLRG